MAAYDIVLHGATGFVGKLVVDYLARHPQSSRFSWAIAGRNADKLARIRESAGARGTEPGVIVTQAADKASVEAMVSQAAVVLNAAGPYSICHGDNVVGACAVSGTHYADLSGEYWYQRRMIDEYHEEAERTGAKIVLAAGVDSIPSDLGVQLAIEHLASKGGRARHAKALFTSYAGSFSGGTRRSMQARKRITQSPEYEPGFHTDPYVLAPGAERSDDSETVSGWDSRRFDADFRRFGGPFFMAPINARVVRRSLALDGHLPCTYAEGISTGAWLKASWLWLSRGFGYFVGAPIPMKPESGEGPPPWLQRAGSFCARVHASTDDRTQSALVEVRGAGDPGYLATSKMFSEVGLALLLDESLPRGGILTPATALGATLRQRLAKAEEGQFMQFRILN
ncbi:MAG: saccharopine dehydrogenase NADP-binding domain-containing protein [Woeseiaceae bacterium]|nr:saccharopine dehydrogenase NADP-binding domain-containing protein [Woeseiaceae bacterium]